LIIYDVERDENLMRKNISVWFALISVVAIAVVFFISLVNGGSFARDPLYIDLMAYPAYVKNGYEVAYTTLDPQLTNWDMVLPANHNRAIRMNDLPPAPYSHTQNDFLSTKDRKIESFTILIRFEMTREQIASLYGDNPIAPGMYLAGIGENWEIYINGELAAKQIYLNQQNQITSFRSQRGVSIPFDKRFLNEGANQLVFHIIGSRSSAYTGLFYTGPYYIGNFTQISSVGIKFLTVALCTFFIFLGFYHVLLFLMRKAEQYNLLFGVFSSLLAAFYFARSSVIYHIFDDTAITKRIEFAALYLVLFALAVFLENLNFGKIKRITIVYGILCCVLIVLQCFFPIWFANDLLTVWQFFAGAYILYILCYVVIYTFVKNIKTQRKEENIDGVPPSFLKSLMSGFFKTELGNIMIPIIIVFFTAAFDMLDLAFFHTGVLLTRYSFSLLMIFMAVTLARKYTNRFEETSQMNEILETTVKQRTQQLEEQVLLAKAASKAKSSFLSNMSHEIRTPMNAILGITEMQLQNEALDHTVRDGLERIHTSGDMLLCIINDILDLSKIEAGRLELVISKYETASFISDTAQLNMMRIGNKPINFELQVEEDLPVTLCGDELRVKQILNNVLSNAFKYTSKGTVKMSISSKPIESNDEKTMLIVSVSDTGQGMSKEQVDKLFDEYSRFNLEANRSTEGTGLGMSITRNLIHMMDGDITIESEPGIGSTFTVFLPQIAADSAVLGREMVETLHNFRSSSREQMKRIQVIRDPMPYGSVLIVDDVETNIFVAKGLIAPYAIYADSVESGFGALRKVESGHVYDVIFMDHMMPGMDGIETTRKLREMGYEQPIVALTANAIVGQAEIFLGNGFDDFISKPIDVRELNKVLNKFVRDKQPPEVIEEARRNAERKTTVEALPNDKVHMFAEIFVRDASKSIAVLEKLFETGDLNKEDDMRTYIIYMHGVKSALANIGRMDLSATALKLEQTGRNSNVDEIYAETPAFLDALRDCVEQLKPKEEQSAEATDEDKQYLKEKLLMIKAACEEFDEKSANEVLTELKQKAWSQQTMELLTSISEKLLHSDFDEIKDEIDKFTKGL